MTCFLSGGNYACLDWILHALSGSLQVPRGFFIVLTQHEVIHVCVCVFGAAVCVDWVGLVIKRATDFFTSFQV